MWSDSDERFAQINEEGDMKDTVGMEMAQANAIVTKKFLHEKMSRNPKSANKISHEYNEFAGIGVGNGSPTVGHHPAVA